MCESPVAYQLLSAVMSEGFICLAFFFIFNFILFLSYLEYYRIYKENLFFKK